MPKLLTANEVAELLNVHRTTLQRWARAGYFPRPTYLGRKAYYDPNQVEQFITNQLQRPYEQDCNGQETIPPTPRRLATGTNQP